MYAYYRGTGRLYMPTKQAQNKNGLPLKGQAASQKGSLRLRLRGLISNQTVNRCCRQKR